MVLKIIKKLKYIIANFNTYAEKVDLNKTTINDISSLLQKL